MSIIQIPESEMSVAQKIARLPREQQNKILSKLTDEQLKNLKHDWDFWGRRKQRLPITDFLEDSHRFCLALSGRGFGKSRMGAEWVRYIMENEVYRHGAMVGPTVGDVRNIMVAAILEVCPDGSVLYEPSKTKLTWVETGGTVLLYSADKPNRLRGGNNEFIWADEFAAWDKAQEAFDQLNLTLRKGRKPKALFTTTPLPLKLIIGMVENKNQNTLLIEGNTFENTNLNKEFFDDIISAYQGTSLYEQEVLGKVLKNMGGLFKPDYISRTSFDEVPAMQRIVVAVDPATTATKNSDETGIAVCGFGVDNKYYLLDVEGVLGSPKEWADRVVALYKEYGADKIIAEQNNGGLMVEETIKQGHKDMPVVLVHASRGKIVRAEPISLLYQKGRIQHIRHNTHNPSFVDKKKMENLVKAEKQMFTFRNNPNEANDLVDAIVWGFTELSGNELVVPQTIKVAGRRNSLTNFKLM
jgi:phage terminase large subunit-like protein